MAHEIIQEAFEKVAKDETRRLSIEQKIMLRSTGYVRRIIAPTGVTVSHLCPHCNSFALEDYIWWVSAGKKHSSWWCAVCGGKHDWRAPDTLLWYKQVKVQVSQKFKAHALKLLANQQKDGDRPIQSIVTGFCEKKQDGYYGGLEKLHQS